MFYGVQKYHLETNKVKAIIAADSRVSLGPGLGTYHWSVDWKKIIKDGKNAERKNYS